MDLTQQVDLQHQFAEAGQLSERVGGQRGEPVPLEVELPEPPQAPQHPGPHLRQQVPAQVQPQQPATGRLHEPNMMRC